MKYVNLREIVGRREGAAGASISPTYSFVGLWAFLQLRHMSPTTSSSVSICCRPQYKSQRDKAFDWVRCYIDTDLDPIYCLVHMVRGEL